jgi:CBS domain-containing protein
MLKRSYNGAFATGARTGARGAAVLTRKFEETLRTILIRDLNLTRPLTVQKGTALQEAIGLMQEQKRPCLMVCDGNRIAGVFTERDILYKLTGEGADFSRPVDTAMTPDPHTLKPEDRVSDAIRMMTEQSYRHIPLVDDDGHFAGFVTARDIIVYIAEHFPTEVLNLPLRLDQTPTRAEGG